MSGDNQNAKVFVGRLPDGCTEKDLEDLFRTYGAVKQTDLIGKYGFVHMIRREDAEEAIKKLNNYNFMGSQLTVQFSTSKMSGNTGKSKGSVNRKQFNRKPGPYNRNNSYPPSQPLMNNRFGGPPPFPPNAMPYYDMNGYREPLYPESDLYYPNQRRVRPPYEPTGPSLPAFGRRGGPPPPPPPPLVDYPPRPPQPDYLGRGDAPYNRPLAYGQNRAIPPEPTPPQSLGYGVGPVRNGYGNPGFANRNAPTGVSLANRPISGMAPPPPPPPNPRWQPY